MNSYILLLSFEEGFNLEVQVLLRSGELCSQISRWHFWRAV